MFFSLISAILLFVSSFVLRYVAAVALNGVEIGSLSLVVAKCADITALLLPFAVYRIFPKEDKKTFELKSKPSVVTLFFITLFVASIASCLEEQMYGISGGKVPTLYEIAFTVVFSVFIVPVAEEYIFRDTVMPLLARCGFLPSAIFASLMFSAIHGVGARAYAFICGLFLAYVYVSYGLKRSIIFHMVINTLNIALAVLQGVYGFKVTVVYLAVSFVLAVVSGVFFIRSAKRSVGNG